MDSTGSNRFNSNRNNKDNSEKTSPFDSSNDSSSYPLGRNDDSGFTDPVNNSDNDKSSRFSEDDDSTRDVASPFPDDDNDISSQSSRDTGNSQQFNVSEESIDSRGVQDSSDFESSAFSHDADYIRNSQSPFSDSSEQDRDFFIRESQDSFDKEDDFDDESDDNRGLFSDDEEELDSSDPERKRRNTQNALNDDSGLSPFDTPQPVSNKKGKKDKKKKKKDKKKDKKNRRNRNRENSPREDDDNLNPLEQGDDDSRKGNIPGIPPVISPFDSDPFSSNGPTVDAQGKRNNPQNGDPLSRDPFSTDRKNSNSSPLEESSFASGEKEHSTSGDDSEKGKGGKRKDRPNKLIVGEENERGDIEFEWDTKSNGQVSDLDDLDDLDPFGKPKKNPQKKSQKASKANKTQRPQGTGKSQEGKDQKDPQDQSKDQKSDNSQDPQKSQKASQEELTDPKNNPFADDPNTFLHDNDDEPETSDDDSLKDDEDDRGKNNHRRLYDPNNPDSNRRNKTPQNIKKPGTGKSPFDKKTSGTKPMGKKGLGKSAAALSPFASNPASKKGSGKDDPNRSDALYGARDLADQRKPHLSPFDDPESQNSQPAGMPAGIPGAPDQQMAHSPEVDGGDNDSTPGGNKKKKKKRNVLYIVLGGIVGILALFFLLSGGDTSEIAPLIEEQPCSPEEMADSDLKSGGERGVPEGEFAKPEKMPPAIVTSGYGPRDGGMHKGADIAGGEQKIYSYADGIVSVVDTTSDPDGYGAFVIIDHEEDGKTFSTLYGHMWPDGIHVEEGQQVKAGEYILDEGTNGGSTGDHLHFEVHVPGYGKGNEQENVEEWVEKATNVGESGGGGGGSPLDDDKDKDDKDDDKDKDKDDDKDDEDKDGAAAATPSASGKTLIIGDSITERSKNEIKDKLDDVDIDSKVGRQFSQGVSILEGKNIDDYDNIVLALGSNGTYTKEDVEKAKDIVDGKPLILMRIGGKGILTVEETNKVLDESNPDGIIDWKGKVDANEDLLDADGIHPSEEGTKAFADAIAEALSGTSSDMSASGASGMDEEDDVCCGGDNLGKNGSYTGNGVEANADEVSEENLKLIIAIGEHMDMGKEGIIISMMTALHESWGAQNLASEAIPESKKYPHDAVAPGDYDSVGTHQQRMHWGKPGQEVESLMQPAFQTAQFYVELNTKNPDYKSKSESEYGAIISNVQVNATGTEVYSRELDRAKKLYDKLNKEASWDKLTDKEKKWAETGIETREANNGGAAASGSGKSSIGSSSSGFGDMCYSSSSLAGISGSNKDVVKMALEIAYPPGRGNLADGDEAKPAYKKYKKAAEEKSEKDPQGMPVYYASCDRVAMTVIKNVQDPDVPWGGTHEIYKYMSSSSKWQMYEDKSDAEPGDVWVTTQEKGGHVLIYVGDVDGYDGKKVVEGSIPTNVGNIGNADRFSSSLVDESGRQFVGFRFTGKASTGKADD